MCVLTVQMHVRKTHKLQQNPIGMKLRTADLTVQTSLCAPQPKALTDCWLQLKATEAFTHSLLLRFQGHRQISTDYHRRGFCDGGTVVVFWLCLLEDSKVLSLHWL